MPYKKFKHECLVFSIIPEQLTLCVLHVLSMRVWPVFETVLMDARNALYFASKFHYCTVFAASGFHVPACAELLEHRPLNPPGLSSERLTLSCLIR